MRVLSVVGAAWLFISLGAQASVPNRVPGLGQPLADSAIIPALKRYCGPIKAWSYPAYQLCLESGEQINAAVREYNANDCRQRSSSGCDFYRKQYLSNFRLWDGSVDNVSRAQGYARSGQQRNSCRTQLARYVADKEQLLAARQQQFEQFNAALNYAHFTSTTWQALLSAQQGNRQLLAELGQAERAPSGYSQCRKSVDEAIHDLEAKRRSLATRISTQHKRVNEVIAAERQRAVCELERLQRDAFIARQQLQIKQAFAERLALIHGLPFNYPKRAVEPQWQWPVTPACPQLSESTQTAYDSDLQQVLDLAALVVGWELQQKWSGNSQPRSGLLLASVSGMMLLLLAWLARVKLLNFARVLLARLRRGASKDRH